MDTLPLELHTQIFQFACTDDGSTARALSLVSRYVRAAAAPFHYQSLAISGLDQMNELVARLEAIPPHLRRIRRLFLSDWTHADTQKRSMSLTDMERYDAEKALASRILDFAAPTLESLAVVASCPYTAPPLVGHLFSVPLPRLRELSIHGFYPFPRLPGTMPKLEQLHLSGNRNPHGLFQLGALEAACPNLTHLRVSDVANATSFARELHAAALPPTDASCDTSPFPTVLPSRLQNIVVEVRKLQQSVRQKGSVKRGTQAAHEKMLALLREVQLRRGDTRLESFLVIENEGCDAYDASRRDWLGLPGDVDSTL
ncbi:hypothetical protein L226DRAFT_538848 [Lentinus tigrinus ALCF2SS1-7]|uniref:F-box domain-containing protein n=1 Tax=Lentinus tigrinus ALCF2SS1-6 TaxID=1328759 RepID=A0A5C2RRX9_9APHY|nr:hypothetical protein L227DRAFT_580947 [Lentinus tigrinus ALCF2SS1-6]RPD70606.1 hypothetical protein L226DRAFT_538848 [Lentinus tigrinus ALCF2SS1-7]